MVDSRITTEESRPGGHPGPSRRGPSVDLVFDRRMAAWLGLWMVNDWLLKPWLGAGPLGIVTGKLSDVAALIVLSVCLAGVLPAVGLTGRTVRASALALPAMALIGLKTSTTVAAGYVALLETATGRPHQVVVDPSDLLALLALVEAARIIGRPRPMTWPNRRRSPVARAAVGGLVAVVATASSFDYDDYDNLTIADGEVVVHNNVEGDGSLVLNPTTGDWTRYPHRVDFGSKTTELCTADEPVICVRRSGQPMGNAIQESTDGGQSWQTVWQVDGSESWVRHRAGAEGDLEVSDMVETADGRIVVAVRHLLPVVRTPDGVWSPSVAELRTFPLLALATVLPGLVAGLTGAAMFGATGRKRWIPLVVVGVATIWLTPAIHSLSLAGFAVAPAALLCTAVAAVAWPLALWWHRRRFVLFIPLLALVAAAVAVAPLGLWATGFGRWTPSLGLAVAVATAAVAAMGWVAGGREPPNFGTPATR